MVFVFCFQNRLLELFGGCLVEVESALKAADTELGNQRCVCLYYMFYLASLQHELAADLLSLSADRLPCGAHTEHKHQGPAHFIYDASSAGGIADKYQNYNNYLMPR